MKAEFKRDLNHNYLILEACDTVYMSDYQIRMIITNHIDGILKCNIRQLDDQVKFYYEITSKQPLSRVFERKTVSYQELRMIISGVMKAVNQIDNYLLDVNNMIFDPEFIYMDIESGSLYFCYLPTYEQEAAVGFHDLSEYLLNHINHSDKESVVLGYDMYKFSMEENYNIQQILDIACKEVKSFEQEKGDDCQFLNKMSQEGPINVSAEEDTDFNQNHKPEHTFQEEDNNKQDNNRKSENKFQKNTKSASYIGNLFVFFIIVLGIGIIVVISYSLIFKHTIFKNLNNVQLGGILLVTIGLISYLLIRRNEPAEECDNTNQNQEDTLNNHTLFTQKREENNEIVQEDQWHSERTAKKQSIHPDKLYNDTDSKDALSREFSADTGPVPDQQKNYYGNTTLLSSGTQPVCKRLICCDKDSSEDFIIDTDSFLIGKLKESVDGAVDNDLVSRIHAKIIREKEVYSLRDLNSTNGTFLNGRRLDADETVEIRDEDEIKFAVVKYRFQ